MDAIVVVDMQVGLLSGAPKCDLKGVVDRINRLTANVRCRSGTVIFVRHCGRVGDDFEPQTPGWEFLPELQRHQADLVAQKTLNDPFAGAELKSDVGEDCSPIGSWSRDGQPISVSTLQ